MDPTFSNFIDFATFNAQRHPNHDIFMVSRANNEWRWDTLSDRIIGPAEANKIQKSLLPRFAQSTGGSFLAHDNLEEDSESSDEEGEDDAELPAMSSEDLLIDVDEHDPISLMLNNAAPRFDEVAVSDVDQKNIVNLIDFGEDIVFPSKVNTLDAIINDLQNLRFDRDFSPEIDPSSDRLISLGPESHMAQDVIFSVDNNTKEGPSGIFPNQGSETVLVTPKKSAISNSGGISGNLPRQKDSTITPSPPVRPVRGRLRKVTSVEPDLEDDDDLFKSPSKTAQSIVFQSMAPLARPNFEPTKSRSSPLVSILVETPTLKQLGMKYNIKYHLVVCTECQGGYGFSHFINHAYTGAKTFSIYDPNKNVYFQPQPAPHHSRPELQRGLNLRRTGGSTKMTDREIQDAILAELKAHGHTPTPHWHKDTTKATRLQWAATAVPHSDQVGPIEGLRIYPHAFRCLQDSCAEDDFPFCSIKDDTMYRHFKAAHPTILYRMGKVKKGVTVQTLAAPNSWISYFEVRPGGNRITPGSSVDVLESVTLQDAVLIQQRELFGDLTADKGLDTDLINPAYAATGMVEFWKTFNFKDIRPLQKIVASQSERILQEDHLISQAVTATFLDISLHAKTANTAILNLITKGATLPHLSHRKKFSIPKLTTLKEYLVTEILLLRWLIYVMQNPILDNKKEPIFKFDEPQLTALSSLTQAARSAKSIQSVAAKAVEALHSLYFPSNPDRAVFNNQAEPVNVFLAILCLTSDGAPRPIPDVPHYCARIQFGIRLRAYHYLFTLHLLLYAQPTNPVSQAQIAAKNETARRPSSQETRRAVATRRSTRTSAKTARATQSSRSSGYFPGDSDSEEELPIVKTMELPVVKTKVSDTNWWQDTAIPWCGRYLTENEPTPYGYVRETMREFSHAVQKHRKQPQVKWIDSQRFLLDHHEIDLHRFRSLLHYRLEELEKFFSEKLLFGHSLESLGIEVNFEALHDTGDVTTLWHSPLLGDITGNPDSDKFLKQLVEDGKLLTRQGTDLVWDTTIAEAWVGDNHEATRDTHTVIHATQGSGGRITEEVKMLCGNSRMSRRHLFVAPGLNTLCLFSNYWKGTSRTGSFKEILRVIPFRASRLIFILIRIIRPIILLYLLKHRFVTEDRTEVITKYRTALWATLGTSLTEKQIYQNIAEFLGSTDRDGSVPFPGFIFGARLFRQFVVTVQKKHIPGSPKYKEASTEESIGDKQAGRSAQTSNQYYGVVESTIDKEPGFIDHFVAYSMKWHEFLQMSTEHDENDQYFV